MPRERYASSGAPFGYAPSAPLDHVPVAPPPHDYRPIRRAFAGFLIGIALLVGVFLLPFAIIAGVIVWAYWEALSWLLR